MLCSQVLDVLDQYIVDVCPDLVVLGSEQLSKHSSELMGSFSLTAVKTLIHVPVLVVKINTMGECHKPSVAFGMFFGWHYSYLKEVLGYTVFL